MFSGGEKNPETFFSSRSHAQIRLRAISDSTARRSGEENRMMQEEQRQRWRQSGGRLKGRDLSELDCMLIEVTCIKWNLIGTDTGSLTDRHDADGLKEGGEQEKAKKREGKQN